ncbi:MAG: alpha/beta hydrolase [Candidatus Bipolaricaulota bacterium]|nr:alpha/beta hydrolase [Candidatus Bipolaricaulota bacterium]
MLIAGIGYGTWLWFKQIPALASHYQLIAFDNRGAGQSDKPDQEYTVGVLAQDAYELLRALGVSSAHILGVSLGGFIAQQLALDHPESVNSLVLCSTSFGGSHMVLPKGEVLQFMAFGAGKETFQYGLELAFSREYLQQNSHEIAQLTRPMRRNPQPRYAYLRQLMAPLNFCSEERLSEIRCPTLILAGEDDPVVPAENSQRLAAKLPQAQLKIFPGTRHLFFIERADEANRAILEFLASLSRPQRERGRG